MIRENLINLVLATIRKKKREKFVRRKNISHDTSHCYLIWVSFDSSLPSRIGML